MATKIFRKGILRVHQSGLPFDVEKATVNAASSPPPVLVMMSGYPDTASSWNRLASHFLSTHHVLQMAMPGYEDPTLEKDAFWGYPLQHICDAVADLVEPYKQKGCKIHLVGHDWGAGIVLVYMKQGKPVDKAVVLDVGVMKELPLKSILVSMLYQSYFALTFLVSRLLPKETWAMPMLMAFPFNLIGPCPYETEVPFHPKDIKIHMLYPYLQIFWPTKETGPLKLEYSESVPQLFMYGTKKRSMFHSQSYLDALEKSPISRYVAFPDSGHWLHWTHADMAAHEMKRFFF